MPNPDHNISSSRAEMLNKDLVTKHPKRLGKDNSKLTSLYSIMRSQLNNAQQQIDPSAPQMSKSEIGGSLLQQVIYGGVNLKDKRVEYDTPNKDMMTTTGYTTNAGGPAFGIYKSGFESATSQYLDPKLKQKLN